MTAALAAPYPKRLDPSARDDESQRFEAELSTRIVGQDRAVRKFTQVYQHHRAGLTRPNRPIANLLLAGPTGCGKTLSCEALAEVVYGVPKNLLKVDCAEYQHSHEIAKLLGSPPGYLGHRETRPLLNQIALDEQHTPTVNISMVLFDEIEKASPEMWNLLLGILDKANMGTGDNQRVDFSRTMIFMTTNLGGSEMQKLLDGGLGFREESATLSPEELDQRLYRVAMDASKRRFPPEFMNRIDKVIVFRSLDDGALEKILNIELQKVHDRILASAAHQFAFTCTKEAKAFLLREGTDKRFGARPLKRTIDRFLVSPLANLLTSGQVGDGDILEVDYDGKSLTFHAVGNVIL